MKKNTIAWLLTATVLAALWAPKVHAATWTVNSLLDNSDGACDAAHCTLREAITTANGNAEADVIDFSVSGTITLNSNLPELSTEMALRGPGAQVLAISRNEAQTPDMYTSLRMFNVSGTVSISGLTLKNGYVGYGAGGAIFNRGTLTVQNSVLSNNFAPQGGAVYNQGALTLRDTVLTNNSSNLGGAIASVSNQSGPAAVATIERCVLSNNQAIYNSSNPSSGGGGAIHATGIVTLTACTIRNNSGNHGGGISTRYCDFKIVDSTINNNSAGVGGAIAAINDSSPAPSGAFAIVTLRNSTLSGNTATITSGLHNLTGLIVVENCTITNSFQNGTAANGGIVNATGQNPPPSTRVRNSLICGNYTQDVKGSGFSSQGYNLVSYGDAVSSFNQPGDRVAGDGRLAPLTNNGGPTQTHALLPDSPALNAGDPSFVSPPEFDQRGAGFPRVQGGRIDIGAFEAPTLTVSNVEVSEINGGTTAIFTVTLPSPATQSLTLNYSTADETANAASDYEATTGMLVFAPGETSKTFSVRINDDLQDEANETFRVQVNAPDNPEVGQGQATGTILDNDAAPRLTINDVTIVEGSGSAADATFTISLSAASGQRVSVSAIPTNGIAKAPGDYQSGGATLTFVPGETTKTFSVPLVGDLLDEADEVFYVLLSSPVNATISRGRGIATIQDDDVPPSISVEDLSIGEGNSGQRVAALRLKLSEPSGQVVRVSFATADGTATAGNDYVAVAATQLAFTTGQTTAIARVLINGDLLHEPNETFFVNLTNPLNATLADNQALGTLLNDDRAPSLSINDVNISEGDSGTKMLTFTVTLSAASGQNVSVNYATANGGARSDIDYAATGGTLNFAPGSALAQTISIPINGDVQVEADETLFVLLSGATNATIGKARGTGTITNDDSSG